MSTNLINRREFLSNAALIGAAGSTVGAGTLLSSCGGSEGSKLVPLLPESKWNIPSALPDKAKDGIPLRAGLVGCGGRGSGAACNFLDAGSNLSVVAIGDMFADRLESCRSVLKEKYNQDIPDDKCFLGFDNYQKVIDAGVDVVILAAPPAFRAQHFKYAVNAGKHIYVEKPLGVDPVSARSIIADARNAQAKGLCVVTGTQRRSFRCYVESYKLMQSGLIGEVVGGNVYFNTNMLWFRQKEKDWTDMEWMIRDWVNWTWLSGDHIVEQHIHDLDVFNWFTGMRPEKALGFGARQRRLTGDQYDMFDVDYTYPGDIHLHSMCRQIDGCAVKIIERIKGTKGVWYGSYASRNEIAQSFWDNKGNLLWQWDFEKEKAEHEQTDEFVLNHIVWINHIRDNNPINQAEEVAYSTLTAIMGRMSAYTGTEVTWDEVMSSNMNLVPDNLELKNMDMKQYTVPVPGSASTRAPRA